MYVVSVSGCKGGYCGGEFKNYEDARRAFDETVEYYKGGGFTEEMKIYDGVILKYLIFDTVYARVKIQKYEVGNYERRK